MILIEILVWFVIKTNNYNKLNNYFYFPGGGFTTGTDDGAVWVLFIGSSSIPFFSSSVLIPCFTSCNNCSKSQGFFGSSIY